MLLQEFDLEIKDKAGQENKVADHLSRLTQENQLDKAIYDSFPDEKIFAVENNDEVPWFANIVNFLARIFISKDMNLLSKEETSMRFT